MNSDTLQATTSRQEIRELLESYHAAVNHRDWELLESVFAKDAVWEAKPPVNLRFEGGVAILDGLKASILRQELLIQTCSGVVVDLKGAANASVRSTLVELGRDATTAKGWTALAFYYDEVIKIDKAWRFMRRTLRLHYASDFPLPGDVFQAARQSL